MYQTKRIHYKIIFKQDGQSETMEYKSLGIIHHDKNTHISFQTQDGNIEIIYDKQKVILKHGNSELNFSYDKAIWNQYQLPYGTVPLQTKLITFIADDGRIKMKYELYDQGGLISTAYILMTFLPYHFQEAL